MFHPEVKQKIEIDQTSYSFVAIPTMDSVVFAEMGKTAKVFKIIGEGKAWALKVFYPPYRIHYWEELAGYISELSDLPGLQVSRRTVLTRENNRELIKQFPELEYAILMPWIEGILWNPQAIKHVPFSLGLSVKIARSFAETLCGLEVKGIAHCDLRGNDIIFSMEGKVSLIDLETTFVDGPKPPDWITESTTDNSFRNWSSAGDRYIGGFLIAQMLGMADPDVKLWIEKSGYEGDLAQLSDNHMFIETLSNSIRKNWGRNVAILFERIMSASSLDECPTLCEWSSTLKGLDTYTKPNENISALRNSGDRIRQIAYELKHEINQFKHRFVAASDGGSSSGGLYSPFNPIDIRRIEVASHNIISEIEGLSHQLSRITSTSDETSQRDGEIAISRIDRLANLVRDMQGALPKAKDQTLREIHSWSNDLLFETQNLKTILREINERNRRIILANGGAYIEGSVTVSHGDFIGREQIKEPVEKDEKPTNEPKLEYKTTLAYPKLFSKRFSSTILVYIYPKKISRKVGAALDKQIQTIGKSVNDYERSESPVDVEKETLAVVKIESPGIEFISPVTIRIEEKETKIVFIAKPHDDCQVGKHMGKLSICDKGTEAEIFSMPFEIKVVDFVFDHVSRPFVYNLAAAFSGLGAFLMFILTYLGQIDTTFGLTSGTTAGLVAITFYLRFASLFQRLNSTTGVS